MMEKFKKDPEYLVRLKQNLTKTKLNPEIEKRRIENSMKVIMTKECLNRRATTNRKNKEKEFVVYKNEEYFGKWVNHSTCAKDLGMNTSSVTRCLTKLRKQCYGYTFKYT
jgi:hypothetical protein